MFYTPNVARHFDSVSAVLGWATLAYNLTAGDTTLRWTKGATFPNDNGGESTVWNVLASDRVCSEWFVLLETETPLTN